MANLPWLALWICSPDPKLLNGPDTAAAAVAVATVFKK
jgi:hypothetical protein